VTLDCFVALAGASQRRRIGPTEDFGGLALQGSAAVVRQSLGELRQPIQTT
jgi:hypothetical protein